MDLLAAEFAKQQDADLKDLVKDQFEGSLSWVTTCLNCKTRSERESKFLELELTLSVGWPLIYLVSFERVLSLLLMSVYVVFVFFLFFGIPGAESCHTAEPDRCSLGGRDADR